MSANFDTKRFKAIIILVSFCTSLGVAMGVEILDFSNLIRINLNVPTCYHIPEELSESYPKRTLTSVEA